MNCKFRKKDGEQCKSPAMKDNDYCYFHDKKMQEKRLESTAKGGRTPKKVFKPLPLVKIDDSKSVVELLTTTINEVRSGDLDVRIANCIGYLAGHLLKAIEQADVSTRLEIIERVILERKSLIK